MSLVEPRGGARDGYTTPTTTHHREWCDSVAHDASLGDVGEACFGPTSELTIAGVTIRGYVTESEAGDRVELAGTADNLGGTVDDVRALASWLLTLLPAPVEGARRVAA